MVRIAEPIPEFIFQQMKFRRPLEMAREVDDDVPALSLPNVQLRTKSGY
jgi:hypothetical protein